MRHWPLAALLAASALAPASASAMPFPAEGPNLSPRLAELARPTVRSAPEAEQAVRLSLAPGGPGSLLREGNRVLVDVRFAGGAAAMLDALRAAGAEVVHLSPRYQTVTVAAKPDDLPAIGDLARVDGVTAALAPIVRGADCGGSVRSEGDVQLDASNARASFGVDGSGVTVGILSDSFDRDPTAATHAAGDVASGDLPGPGSPCGSTSPVGVLDDPDAGGADEGRAMAQVVHDLAPGAGLAFASATALNDQYAFADGIRSLKAAGAEVIADDVFYLDEPFFQEGPIAVAADEAAAAGATYLTAAGNDNVIVGGRDVGSWEGRFQGSGGCPAPIPDHPEQGDQYDCMDFDGSGDTEFAIEVKAKGSLLLDLQWAEPWFAVGTDLDAYLLDESNKVVAKSEGDNSAEGEPFEFLPWDNPKGSKQTVRLVIKRFSGAADPLLKFAMLDNGAKDVVGSEYPESTATTTVGPTILGHSGAAGAISVGAVPYDDGSEPEYYSSRGPATGLHFGPVAGTAPASPLVPPQVLAKPDVVATDCGATTFFASFSKAEGVWRFCGTSAAAPHAAAVAALVRQANPGASAAQVRADLTATARPVGAFGPGAVGAGLLDAYAAVKGLALPPKITITKAPAPLSRNRRPGIEFTANRPVAFSCQVDGGVPQPCASPFVVPVGLADGAHGIAVSGVDLAGRIGGSGTASFVIDTKAPRTSIVKHPPKLVRTHRRQVRETFRFRANEAGVAFVCKVDRGLLRFCGQRFSRRFAAGRHTLTVRARDAAGNVDRSPAVFRFRVKRLG
jgi:hypothetical protein